MSLSPQAIEQLLQDSGIDPQADIGDGQTAFSYLEACVMSAIDEIEDRIEEGE